MIAVALVARVVLAHGIAAPWVMPDELEYAVVARSFAASGHYIFRGHPFAIKTIYPALISPAWFAHSISTSYGIAKLMNAVMMTAGAVPLFLWARRLVSPLWSVVVVLLFLAIPSFIYTSELLTENAYLPAVLLTLFALSLALERPTVLRQLLTLAAVVLALAVRSQAIVFGLIVPTAIILKIYFDLRAAPPNAGRGVVQGAAKRWWPTIAALVVAVAAYVVYKKAQGASLSSGFGNAAGVVQAHYSLREASRWVLYHFGEIAFSVAVVPLSALIVLAGLACRRATAPQPRERAFLATTLAAVFWTVVQAGTFASHYSLRIEERYMFNVAPALLLALVVWLARGLPRPPGLTAAAVLVPVALVLMIPFTAVLNGAVYNDTFGLVPVMRVMTRLGNTFEPQVLVGLSVLLVGLLFATLARRTARWLIPCIVFLFLVVSSGSVYASVAFRADAARHAGGLQGDPSWIDHRIGRNARAEFLYTTDLDSDPHVLWQAEFWNRSVRRVFGVTSTDPSIPDITAPLNPATGRIVPVLPAGSPDRNPRYAVSARAVDVDGTKLGHAGFLALYRVHQPLRLANSVEGVSADGWTGATAAYNGYTFSGTTPGTMPVLLSLVGVKGPPPAHVRVVIGRLRVKVGAPSVGSVWQTRTVTVPSQRQVLLRLPVRETPFRIELLVNPTFSPSQYGSPDTRVLGVRVFFLNRLG